jgi:hypothetical protein
MDYPSMVIPAVKFVENLESGEELGSASLEPAFAAMLVKILWDAGELKALSQFLQNQSFSVDPNWCLHYRINKHLITLVSDAATSSDYEAWKELHERLLQGMSEVSDDELVQLEAVADALNPSISSASSGPAIRIVKKWLTLYREFHRGRQVNLSFDEESAHWTWNSRVTALSADTVEVQCENSEAITLIKSLQRFPKPYTVNFELQQMGQHVDTLGLAFLSRPLSNSIAEISDCYELRVSPSVALVQYGIVDSHDNRKVAMKSIEMETAPAIIRIRIEVRKDGAVSTINDLRTDEVDGRYSDFHSLVFSRQPTSRGITVDPSQVTYRISNVKLQKLDE